MKIIFVVAGLLLACAQSKQDPGLLTREAMQSDFDTLMKAMDEVHGGQYRFVDKGSLDEALSTHRAKIDEPKSKREFIAIVCRALSEFRDGHVRLEYDDQTNAKLRSARMFPLRLTIESAHLLVMYNDTPADTNIKPGMEIVSINGHDANGLIATMLEKTSGDGFSETCRPRRVERNFAENFWLFVDPTETFDVTARSDNGKLVSAHIAGVTNLERPANRNKNPVNATLLENWIRETQAQNISLTFLKRDSVACLSVRTFSAGSEFTSQLDSVFRVVRARKPKGMILDLRGNGGGTDEYGAYLVGCFMDKPFRYFEKIRMKSINPSFAKWNQSTYDELKNGTISDGVGGYLVTGKLHSGVDVQPQGKYPFHGTLVVLMNGSTFSTAADVTSVLRGTGRAIFVGEESGGAYEGNNSGLNAKVTLPNSGLSLRVPMYEYWNAVPKGEKGRGTLADYPLENKLSDLIQGVDAQKTKAMEILQHPANPRGK